MTGSAKGSRAPNAEAPVRTRTIVGIPFAMVDYDAALDAIDAMVAGRKRGYVVASAVHAAMVAQEDPEMMSAMRGASLVVPDGMPLVWAARALGETLHDRVYGPTLMARQCERAATSGQRVWLYGGRDDGALDQLVDRLGDRFPSLRIVGATAPPHAPVDDLATESVAARINAARPDIVFVGIGVPKQELWMARMRPALEAPVLMGVGAAFDFHAGLVPQAPAWMQSRGLEWLYRSATEPRRLLPRYLKYNPSFIATFTRQLVRERRSK